MDDFIVDDVDGLYRGRRARPAPACGRRPTRLSRGVPTRQGRRRDVDRGPAGVDDADVRRRGVRLPRPAEREAEPSRGAKAAEPRCGTRRNSAAKRADADAELVKSMFEPSVVEEQFLRPRTCGSSAPTPPSGYSCWRSAGRGAYRGLSADEVLEREEAATDEALRAEAEWILRDGFKHLRLSWMTLDEEERVHGELREAVRAILTLLVRDRLDVRIWTYREDAFAHVEARDERAGRDAGAARGRTAHPDPHARRRARGRRAARGLARAPRSRRRVEASLARVTAALAAAHGGAANGGAATRRRGGQRRGRRRRRRHGRRRRRNQRNRGGGRRRSGTGKRPRARRTSAALGRTSPTSRRSRRWRSATRGARRSAARPGSRRCGSTETIAAEETRAATEAIDEADAAAADRASNRGVGSSDPAAKTRRPSARRSATFTACAGKGLGRPGRRAGRDPAPHRGEPLDPAAARGQAPARAALALGQHRHDGGPRPAAPPVVDPVDPPLTAALSFVGAGFETAEKVLKAVRIMQAQELAAEPMVRHFLQEMASRTATITTAPTAKGRKLTVTHELFSVAHVKRKPCAIPPPRRAPARGRLAPRVRADVPRAARGSSPSTWTSTPRACGWCSTPPASRAPRTP